MISRIIEQDPNLLSVAEVGINTTLLSPEATYIFSTSK